MLFAVILTITAGIIYYYCKKTYSYWKDKGVNQGQPVWFLGDTFKLIFRLEGFSEQQKRFYEMSPGSRYSGVYETTQPQLILRDPDLIKQITVKDFEHFMDRKSFVPKNNEPLWNKNVVLMEGQEWKEMRNLITPSFTSSKMKILFNLITECAENFVQHFKNEDKDLVEVDTQEVVTCFANDSIATVAYGVKVDSLKDRNNEFLIEGRKSADFGFMTTLKVFGYALVPQLFEFFKISILPSSVTKFFTNVVVEALRIREEKGIVRPDMLHLLMEARKALRSKLAVEKSGIKDISDEDIAAQAFIFYLGGFDTVTSHLCCLIYEMAVNPDIQSRLRKEVEETMEKCEGNLTYDALMEMKYMDMVLSETLRKWPSMINIQRICTKPYTIEPTRPGEKPLLIEKGVEAVIPTIGIHWDPKYYPNPGKFDPERFNDKNKGNINPYAYLPFGVGPRSCLGNRFSLLEAKTLLFYILHNFEIVPVAKSVLPMKPSKTQFSLKPEGKLILGLKTIKRYN